MLPKEYTPDIIIEILQRRKWWIIIPIVLSLMVMGILLIGLPRTYLAETLILVQAQRVPQDYIRSTVTIDLDQRLRTISQQVTSRTRLLKVINDLNLGRQYSKNLSQEDLISTVRNNIRLGAAGKNMNSFTIGFLDREPEVAARAANALASLFIEENLKVREEQAKGTTSFLENELETMKERLEEQEKKLKSYKQQNMGELPEQLAANISTITGSSK